ncbi:MAG TPA: DUF2493 domain-containing protein [Candidatus Limnocylindria bacterium]|nr:DUF2493 domain-containing protein [Candidatus Limnocylindria bacterium]
MNRPGIAVVVTGGRKFTDLRFVFATLDRIHAETPIVRLAHGGATGADSLADFWAHQNRVPEIKAYEARWDAEGKSAGPLRNVRMLTLEKPDLVVAFPGGRGTADCVERAIARGMRVEHYTPGGA